MTTIEYVLLALGSLLSVINLRDAYIGLRHVTQQVVDPATDLTHADVCLIALAAVVREAFHLLIFGTLAIFLVHHGVGDTSSVCVASIVMLKSLFNRVIRIQLQREWWSADVPPAGPPDGSDPRA